MNYNNKILIVSAGNSLMKDDGLGYVALQKLQSLIKNNNIHFFDAGTDIFKLLTIQDEYDKIIILDAIKTDSEPGTIYRIPLDEITPINTPNSAHRIKLTEALHLIKMINTNLVKSDIILYGIEPYEISLGEKITSVVEKSINYLVELVYTEIENARSYGSKKYN